MCRIVEWMFLSVALWNLFAHVVGSHRTPIVALATVLGSLIVAALFGLRADLADALDNRRS